MYRALKNASTLNNEFGGPCDITHELLWVRLPPSLLRHSLSLALYTAALYALLRPLQPPTLDGLTSQPAGHPLHQRPPPSILTVPIGVPSVFSRPCNDAPRRSAAVQSDRVESDFILLGMIQPPFRLSSLSTSSGPPPQWSSACLL